MFMKALFCTHTTVLFSFSLNDLKDMQFVPVHVRGTFDYDREIFLGPKIDTEEARGHSVQPSHPVPGVHVITPFKLADRE